MRVSLFLIAVPLWIAFVLWMTSRDDIKPAMTAAAPAPPTGRDVALLLLSVAPFVPYVYGVLNLDWGFNELTALFLVSAFAIGLLSGRTLSVTAADFLKGMETVLAASLFVGVARGISVVLTDGRIIDTIIYGLAAPLDDVPGAVAAILMIPAQALIHIPVPSTSGQAVLTMPIMAPLADLLGFSRDAAVIAYQMGAGLMDLFTPTNGALLAVLMGAGVPYGRWVRYAVPGVAIVVSVGVAGILLAL